MVYKMRPKILIIAAAAIVLTLFVQCRGENMSKSNRSKPTLEDTHSCFTKDNFDQVYRYLEREIKQNSKEFYSYSGYDLYLSSNSKISLKKDNYTLSVVEKGMGVYSLAKGIQDYERLVIEAHAIFCKLLAMSKNHVK